MLEELTLFPVRKAKNTYLPFIWFCEGFSLKKKSNKETASRKKLEKFCFYPPFQIILFSFKILYHMFCCRTTLRVIVSKKLVKLNEKNRKEIYYVKTKILTHDQNLELIFFYFIRNFLKIIRNFIFRFGLSFSLKMVS